MQNFGARVRKFKDGAEEEEGGREGQEEEEEEEEEREILEKQTE